MAGLAIVVGGTAASAVAATNSPARAVQYDHPHHSSFDNYGHGSYGHGSYGHGSFDHSFYGDRGGGDHGGGHDGGGHHGGY
ncbi:hypothetical protein [Streptomyces sp. NPDC058476]|uniref:hypothetical protein n=1 Tax=Streptomyces sp. NPDC058476 TaxID=3346519 RepID=UPI00364E9F6D